MTSISKTKVQKVIEEVLNGKTQAFSWLVEQYQQSVYKIAYNMVLDKDSAQDITQDVFIRFYKSIHQYKGESSLKTYLSRIAINLSLNHLKSQKAKIIKMQEYEIQAERNKMKQQSDLTRWELKEQIQLALQKLDPVYRSVVILRLVEGLSVQETAKVLNIPPGTVGSRLLRGQKKLREILKKYDR